MTFGSTTLTLADEKALAAQAKADPAAFAAIYDHYYPRIFNYAMVRLRDPDAANDVTAEAFERVLRSLDSYRPERGELGGWIFAIARNAVNGYQRAASRRRWLPLTWIERLAGQEPGPEAVTVKLERKDRLLGAVGTLAAHEQEILALKYGAELTNRDIARMVGRSESNIGVILYRALKKLRDMLRDMQDDKETVA